MNFNVIAGNTTIINNNDGTYNIIYCNPSHGAGQPVSIQQFKNLTIDEMVRLPFIDGRVLVYLK